MRGTIVSIVGRLSRGSRGKEREGEWVRGVRREHVLSSAVDWHVEDLRRLEHFIRSPSSQSILDLQRSNS